MKKYTTDKKWLQHLEASRTALTSVLGFYSYEEYKRGRPDRNYSKRAAQCLRGFLPYSIQKIGENSGKVIILNRDYKPIGYCGSYFDWVKYEDFDSAIADVESPEMQAFLTACNKDRAGKDWTYFTFNDATAPWGAAKNAKRLLGIIDAALSATTQEEHFTCEHCQLRYKKTGFHDHVGDTDEEIVPLCDSCYALFLEEAKKQGHKINDIGGLEEQ